MYKIGIIGSENSHADAFAAILGGGGKYPDISVTHIGGYYPEESRKLAEKYGLKTVSEPGEMLGKVDAVMITTRDGKYHAEIAHPFVAAGIPLFIDKPFTVNPREAISLVEFAKTKNVPICGGSSLKYLPQVTALHDFVRKSRVRSGEITAPVMLKSEYSGFYFYASHLTEILLTVFGYNPVAVTAVKHGGDVAALFDYDSFSVTANYLDSIKWYHASVVAHEKAVAADLDISSGYEAECEAFAAVLRTGKMSGSYEELVKPVICMQAVVASYENCNRQLIDFGIKTEAAY